MLGCWVGGTSSAAIGGGALVVVALEVSPSDDVVPASLSSVDVCAPPELVMITSGPVVSATVVADGEFGAVVVPVDVVV